MPKHVTSETVVKISTGPEAFERTLMSMPICGITLKYLKLRSVLGTCERNTKTNVCQEKARSQLEPHEEGVGDECERIEEGEILERLDRVLSYTACNALDTSDRWLSLTSGAGLRLPRVCLP